MSLNDCITMTASTDYKNFQKLYKRIALSFISLSVTLLIFTTLISIRYITNAKGRDFLISSQPVGGEKSMDYTQGIFYSEGMRLTRETTHLPFPNLSEEIVLLGKNDRPDASHTFLKLLLGLKSSGEVKEYHLGDKGYLGISPGQQEGLGFHQAKTPFWFVPILENKELKILSGFAYEDTVQHEWVEEEAEFIIDKSSHSTIKKIRSPEFLKILQSMQYFLIWPEDRLLQMYGGENFKDLKGAVRLACKTSLGWQMIFIKQGDGLVYRTGEWSLTHFGPQTKDAPIALVENIGDKVYIKVWDITGFDSAVIEIPLAKISSSPIQLSDIMTEIRQRTLQSISCKMGNKKTILKKGDWIVKYPSGWKILETKQEMQNFLNYQIDGELLIFEKLERKKHQTIFHGTWFDKTRSQVQWVVAPIGEAPAKKTPVKNTKISKDLVEDPQPELDVLDELY